MQLRPVYAHHNHGADDLWGLIRSEVRDLLEGEGHEDESIPPPSLFEWASCARSLSTLPRTFSDSSGSTALPTYTTSRCLASQPVSDLDPLEAVIDPCTGPAYCSIAALKMHNGFLSESVTSGHHGAGPFPEDEGNDEYIYNGYVLFPRR
jgi:hypothetical protein